MLIKPSRIFILQTLLFGGNRKYISTAAITATICIMEWMIFTLTITTVMMIVNMIVNRLARDIAHHQE